MGYSLKIGEAELDIDYEQRLASFEVEKVDGSAFGAPLNTSRDHSNCIHPGYGSMSTFVEHVGLFDVFAGDEKDGIAWNSFLDDEENCHTALLAHDSGCVPLNEYIYRRFLKAQQDFIPPADPYVSDTYRKRLEWLVFWTRWALDHCMYPSFYHG